MIFIPFLLFLIFFAFGPLVGVTLLEKRKISLPKIALYTAVIPVISLLGVAFHHDSLVTTSHSISGLFGCSILQLNMIGCSLANMIFHNGNTWGLWITAFTLNWMALNALAYALRQYSLHPRVQPFVIRAIQIAAFFYVAKMVVNSIPSVIESIHYLIGH